MLAKITPRSSSGDSSCFMVGNTSTMATPLTSITPTTSQRACSTAALMRCPMPGFSKWLPRIGARAVTIQRSAIPYRSDMRVSRRSIVRSNQLGFGLCLRSWLHIIGVNVKATTPETTTAPASARANSTKRRPVRPGVKANGAYTATKVAVIVTTAKPISRAPLMLAENGSMPSSMCRKIFSSITIASSTTKPIANTSANSVRVLIEKPAKAIKAKVPTRLTGIVMMGISEARRVRKNTKITSATRITASTMVL